MSRGVRLWASVPPEDRVLRHYDDPSHYIYAECGAGWIPFEDRCGAAVRLTEGKWARCVFRRLNIWDFCGTHAHAAHLTPQWSKSRHPSIPSPLNVNDPGDYETLFRLALTRCVDWQWVA